jgi:hypothetical protein
MGQFRETVDDPSIISESGGKKEAFLLEMQKFKWVPKLTSMYPTKLK